MTPTSYYILDNNEPIEATLEEWSAFFATPERFVAEDIIGEVRVSTVFIGLDATYDILPGIRRRPLLWETMIFGGKHHNYEVRYARYQDAVAGHHTAVNLVKKDLPDAG